MAQGRRNNSGTPPPGSNAALDLAYAAIGLFVGILCLYAPAMKGHFVFDDSTLPFATMARNAPLHTWLFSTRPVLMFSYWLNYQLWGLNPFSYHLMNVLIHSINTALAFAVLARLLAMAGWPRQKGMMAAAIGALIFAVHPLQTESVSYVAGRSESLASMFLLLGYVVFLYRRNESISWLESVAVLLLFATGVATKQNAVSLAGILVLTDLSWPEPFSLAGIRRNWRLYSILAPATVIAGAAVFWMLGGAPTAGFSVANSNWYQYGFTEARAIFTYLRLAVFPVGQSLDQDYAMSHTIFEHRAIYYVAALAALVALAIQWRQRYPLFCFGLLMFLGWLAPTSSIVPVSDALVERRMYLPLVGLILIGCELVSRVRVSRPAGLTMVALAALVYGKLCYDRNQLWGQPDRLIELAAAQAVYNPRPMLNLTEVLIRQNRCEIAPPYLVRAERILGSNYYVNVAWGRTLACLGRFDEAVDRLQTAARLQPGSQVYEWLGLVYGQMGLVEAAGTVLEKAVSLDPNSPSAHGSLALWYEETGNYLAAREEYRKALSLDRYDWWAQIGLLRARSAEGSISNAP